jgi:polyvinyl alcohol dehydrogenase (cytochrome)
VRKLRWVLIAGIAMAGVAGQNAIAATPTAEWPVYGANSANTRTVPGGPTAGQVPTLHVAWRDSFSDGDFTGTPIVYHGVVYVGSNGGIVRAIQARATSTHHAGAVLWMAKVAGPVDGSLAAAGASVFVPVARLGGPELVALNAGTGQMMWATTLDQSTDASVYGSPVPVALGTGTVVLQGVSATSGDPASLLRGSLSAVNAATGSVLWKTYMVPPGSNGGAVWSTPAVDLSTGSVFVGTGNAYSGTAAPTTDAMVKLKLSNGQMLGWFQGTANDVFSSNTPGLDFDFGASPNLMHVGGRTLIGEGQKSGSYWALDAATMKPVWHSTLGVGSVLGGVLGSTAFDPATGHLYGPESVPGYVWSIAAADGSPAWVTPGGLDPAHLSPVSVSNGVVYSVTSTGFVEAWSEATGLPAGALPLNPVPPNGSYVAALAGPSGLADLSV